MRILYFLDVLFSRQVFLYSCCHLLNSRPLFLYSCCRLLNSCYHFLSSVCSTLPHPPNCHWLICVNVGKSILFHTQSMKKQDVYLLHENRYYNWELGIGILTYLPKSPDLFSCELLFVHNTFIGQENQMIANPPKKSFL